MIRTYGSRHMTKPEGFLRAIHFPALAFTETLTGDGRFLEDAGGGSRELPLTIWGQFKQSFGHEGSVIIGRLDEITFGDDGVVSGWGWVLDDDNGRDAVKYVKTQAMRGNSVDLADIKAHYEWDDENDSVLVRFTQWNIGGTTLVGRPAFKDAHAVLDEEVVASWYSDDEPLIVDVPCFTNITVAEPEVTADGSAKPRWDLFNLPESPTPTKIFVGEPDERGYIPVFGHLGLWNTCHDGYERCLMIPRSPDNYASFCGPGVLTDKGVVNTGPIFFKGGHPKAGSLRKTSVEDAYGGVENTWADVRVVDGALGPWLSGYVRPGVDEETIVAARASKISGHWLGGKLMAIVSVNVAGYDVPTDSFSMNEDGFVDELVASFPACTDSDETSASEDDEHADDTADEVDLTDLAFALHMQDLDDE